MKVDTLSDGGERPTAAERYTRRLNVQISAEDEAALKIAHVNDRLTTAARVRAMLSLWRAGGEYGRAVDHRARQLENAGSAAEALDAAPAQPDPVGEPDQARLSNADRLTGLGQLASGVAHEFNNLLGVILSSTALVAERMAAAAQSDDKQQWSVAQHDVEQIRLAGERATALTRQLLTYGRREVVQPRVIDLNEVVSDVEDMLRRTIGGRVEFAISLQPDLWPVLADPGQLGQVLLSLVADARQAMPDGGILTVDTANLTVDEDYSTERLGVRLGRMVRLRIGATGAGLPADIHEQIFDPFFSGKPGGSGAGLSLPAIHGIVTAADGHIQLYSQPGMGTTFTVLLPAAECTDTVQQPASSLVAPSGQTVLLVEDGQPLRGLTERMLSRAGYQVIAAGNGADAVRAARDHDGEIHLLLTDVVMPQVRGKEVAAQVREVRPNLAVLYMSGYPEPILAYEGHLDPGVTVLEKPFSEADLLSKASTVLGNFAGFTTVQTQTR
jgi:signal transduction histidine kinase/CheY-like chemotaxis protein